jgi:hypothetical protein
MVFLTVSIYPFINISKFPFRFHIKDSWINPLMVELPDFQYDIKLDTERLDIDDLFFYNLDHSKYVAEFLQSENYKNAEKLFNLAKDKKKFEEFFDSQRYVKMEDYIENANLSAYFPFEPNTINDADCWIKCGSINCGIEIKKSSNECSVIQILGDLLCLKFYIGREDLKLIVLDNLFKIGLPDIPKSYVSELLSSYEDLKYKYITLIKIDCKFNYPTILLEILKRLTSQFSHKTAFLEYSKFKFFICSLYDTPVFVIDNNMMIRYLSVENIPYIIIYSNEHPLENEILQEFEKGSRYFVDNWTILEIEKI